MYKNKLVRHQLKQIPVIYPIGFDGAYLSRETSRFVDFVLNHDTCYEKWVEKIEKIAKRLKDGQP